MARVVRVIGVRLHPQAECEDCEAFWGSSVVTRDLAKQHASETGHAVFVETITRDKYAREPDPSRGAS